ncbi:MAG: L-lactate dehydrogenase [Candidatus Paceibacterota bacterium]
MTKLPKYDNNKIAIVGCGRVGMSTAFALLLKNIPNELLLISRSEDKVKGEELDLEHGLSFMGSAQVHSSSNYEDLKNTDVVIIAAGSAQKPGDTRLDLTTKNKEIIREIIPKVVKYAPEAIIVIISNPVDVLTYEAYKIANLPKGQIFGTGTTLDTSRFRFHLSENLKVNPRSIHAYILGEHGDTSFPALASATVGGQNLLSLPDMTIEKAQAAYQKTRDAAYKIIATKGATYYAIAVATTELVEAVLRDSKRVFPVSAPLHNYQGHSGVALSVPCVIGRSGVEQTIEIKLSWDEKQLLEKSVNTLKQYL